MIETQAPVRRPADMDRNVIRILMPLLLVALGVAETTDPLTDLENIAGKLVFYQMEGNATYVRDTGELASDVPTETMFELFDPQKNFSQAKFTYTWDLGNGEVIQGTEPVVRYHYSESGNYTLRLKVGVNVTKYTPLLTDVYSMDVKVLDAIKNIELKGPSDYEVSQNTTLAFHVDGSPPMWVCWRFLPNCVQDMTGGCTLTMLQENTLQLNLTFTSAGVHCLDISVRNDISKLQSSFSLYVKRSNNTHMFFILSCAAVLVATFTFIIVFACRPRHHNRSQIAASSNTVFLKNQDPEGQGMILFNFTNMERGEKEPLLLQYETQYFS
ncbi:transmembrane protein 130 isoform X1 [Micropterus salmoides]|uniref:transmembrane protein 130 isoform X1 n=2 Tax=Micropterus salmoides TaxID=27706 RepID=UPI0018EC73E1|nr:transmembrane protein 130 isoform X1 [Micropterus salmoides]